MLTAGQHSGKVRVSAKEQKLAAEKNKKQRKDCNAKMLLNRKRKQENGGEAGKRHMLLILW